jgi:hypothetical protein
LTGLKYSWHNGQQGDHVIQKKLDWIFGNSNLFASFPAAQAIFLPREISDHSAMLLSLNPQAQQQQSTFKFLNTWTDREDFNDVVSRS